MNVSVSSNSLSTTPIVRRTLAYPPTYKRVQQAWVENLNTVEEQKLGLIDLHPDVFGAQPRIDIIQENIEWQTKYRKVVCNHMALLKYLLCIEIDCFSFQCNDRTFVNGVLISV
jgi:large subunit ribosomal protein L4